MRWGRKSFACAEGKACAKEVRGDGGIESSSICSSSIWMEDRV